YRQADFMSIAIESAGELIRNDHTDTRSLDGLGCDRPAGRTSKVAARYENISLLNLFRKLGIQRFENMFCHFLKSLPHHLRWRDFIGRNVVTELPAAALKDERFIHGAQYCSANLAADFATE